MHHLGRHRMRPALSNATHAKREIEQLEIAIERAKAKGDTTEVERLENRKNWAVVNSFE